MSLLSELNPAENLCALVVGNAGCGKSTAVASFASASQPMYIFDCDNRIKGILASKRFLGDSLGYIEQSDFSVVDTFETIEDKLMEIARDVENNKEKCKYKHIVFDSVGSLSAIFTEDSQRLHGLKREAGKKLPTDRDKPIGAKITGQVSHNVPQDYEYTKTCFRRLFYRYFRHINQHCNVWMSAWTMDRWGKDPKNPYGPDILLPGKKLNAPPSIASELPGYFDEIWEFDKREQLDVNSPAEHIVRFNTMLAKTAIENVATFKGPLTLTNRRFKEQFDQIVTGASPSTQTKAKGF
jgi:ABC-type dipeptide/oligopeptide/nickel transport system ATPase component